MLRRAVTMCLLSLPFVAFGQVHSVTLGIDVNSPYGLSEPWFTIRGALLRCEEIESVAERPDLKTRTAAIKTKGGALPDPAKLERALKESGAGARLRSVEVIAEGELVRKGEMFHLRLPDRHILLRISSKPEERQRDGRYRVNGVLHWSPDLLIEVKTIEKLKTKNS